MSLNAKHALLDEVITRNGIKNDAELARRLELKPPQISKVRNGALPVGSTLILRLHEVFAMPVAEIRELAAA